MISIFQLRQLNAEQLAAGRKKLSRERSVSLEVIDGKSVIARYRVNGYEVARLAFGVFCECKDFQFSGDACKHIAAIMPPFCDSCMEPIKAHGKCRGCGIEKAIYLKETSTKKRETIGNIRI